MPRLHEYFEPNVKDSFEKKEKPLDTKETINEANKVMFDEVYRSYLKDFNIK
jgi:hypothetical protein